MGKPNKLERETIIVFNEEEDTASVFTYSKRWQTILEQRCKGVVVSSNLYGGREYEIAKSCIRVPLPSRKSQA